MRKPYPSDMTDAQWGIIEPMIPIYTLGRPREVDITPARKMRKTPARTASVRFQIRRRSYLPG